jgi:hypothetical protein
MSHPTPRREEIAAEAARAARAAAEEATEPEARFFLRQHAILLERIAASYRRIQSNTTSTLGTRLALAVPLIAELSL